MGFLLFAYEPRYLFSTAAVGLMATVSTVTFGIAAFAGQEYPQFIPLPAAALVLTIFFGPRVATAMAVIIMIFLKVDGLVDIGDLVALGTASVVAIGIHIKERKDLMVRGVLIGIMQAAGYLFVVVATQSVTSLPAFGAGLLLQLLGGLSSSIVAIGSLPFLESIFGLVTPFRLAELTDPDQPLLRGLNEHAPGTYQHSLAVANLAEAGARSIGCDVNLARAGSLYHDIGKMVRPVYFIENQLGAANPHDSIEPEESRDRVLAHVTDGVVLAEKNGLPKLVTDFIPQHQGTSIMAYFYHKACQRDGVENVDVNFYRYPGPKPQCKEAAIVMLADVSEAVTHSLKEPTQEEADKAIDLVFKARWDDGQFNESGLTQEELEKVKTAFGRVWRTLHHERLKYPSTTTGRMAVPPNTSTST
jgi:putative nucleotidyltransferase with HDIG domain